MVAALAGVFLLSEVAPCPAAGSLYADNRDSSRLKTPWQASKGGYGPLIAARRTKQQPAWVGPNAQGTTVPGNPSKPVPLVSQGREKKPQDPAGTTTEIDAATRPPGMGDEETTAAPQKSQSPEDGLPDDIATLFKDATELTRSGAHEEALSRYEAAIKKASGPANQKLLAEALHGAARNLHELGKDQQAQDYVNRSIAINQTLKNARASSLDYILLGRILVALSDYPQALNAFREAAKILPSSEASEMPQLAEATAACLLRLNHHSEALVELNRSLSLRVKEGNNAEIVRLHLLMGDVQVSRADYQAARTNFKKAEELSRNLQRNEDVGKALFRIAYLDLMTGDLTSANKNVEEGRKLLRGKTDPEIDALPLLVKGLDAHNRGMVIQALRDVSEALNRYERGGDRLMAARARLALANVQMDRSNLKSALELGGTVLTEFRSLSAQAGEAAALTLIAEVYFRQGYVHKAMEYAQEALALSKKAGDKNRMVQSRILLAEIHWTLGDAAAAAKLLKEALEDATTGANRRTRARLNLAVARFRFSRESLDKAFQDTETTHKEFLEINDRRGAADCALLMGML